MGLLSLRHCRLFLQTPPSERAFFITMATVYEIKAQKRRLYSKLRHQREKIAREKGTHTKQEWDDMLDFFESTCAICFGVGFMTKDHIIPIYFGGCDSIKNLQPLCKSCNSGKDDFCDYRWQLANYLNKKLPLIYRQPLSYHGETIYSY